MDSSPVLRQQSQNKISREFQRAKNEHNKMPTHLKPSKLQSSHHLHAVDLENQDPGHSQKARKAPLRPGVSRLPVLAKSLHLQTPSDFSQSHCRWEDKPLAGKARKKRPCTRPIPFNFSQPRSSRNQEPQTVSQSSVNTRSFQPENNVCNGRLKNPNLKVKSSCIGNVEPTKGTGKTHMSQPSGRSAPTVTFKTSTTLSHPSSSIPGNATHQNSTDSSAQPAVSAEACSDTMNLLTLNESTKTSSNSQTMQLAAQNTARGDNFKPDHAALLSVLRNEGVSATGLASATPQSKPYNYLPQRVSIMKSRQKATAKLVQFSPDAAALQSILQNEGVKAGGPVGPTPIRNPVRPSGRGTSIYTARRVPVRKNHAAEANVGPVALRETPQKTWTPQRVRDTRHQSMSAMKWHLSNQQSPYVGSTALQSCKFNPRPHQEEVVQRLFDDQEDEKTCDQDPEAQAGQLPVQATATKSRCEGTVETNRADSHEDEDEDEEKEQRITGGQPFFQSLQRESVIFFSTGKKLLRAPRVEQPEVSTQHKQHEKTTGSETARPINPSAQSLHRDLVGPKTVSLSPAVALLRKRHPPLEELIMDEEVATYTSVSAPAAPGFLPPRPRCGNPLASILHFEESSRFVPISCDFSSGPSPPQSCLLQER